MEAFKFLEVYQFGDKERCGRKGDGGYVIGCLDTIYDSYISCGVGNEESFTRDFLLIHSYLEKEDNYAFDGVTKNYPWRFTDNITFINKNINAINDNKNTNLSDLLSKYQNIFLSMDIEGAEYRWLSAVEVSKLKNIAQLVIEVHGIWGFDHKPKKKRCWADESELSESLSKLNTTHHLIHAHGNNYGPIREGIPNVLELTYVNKKFFLEKPPKNTTPLPIPGLDFQNRGGGEDYSLNRPPFTYSPNDI